MAAASAFLPSIDWPNSAASPPRSHGYPRRSSTRFCRGHGPDRTPSISLATPTLRAMRRRSKVLLADAGNDAILVMNVQTAIASADEIAARVIELSASTASGVLVRLNRCSRCGSARTRKSTVFSGAGIPNYPTEDDAVRGFMHLVQHREIAAALVQVPPAMPSEFAPDAMRPGKSLRLRSPTAASGLTRLRLRGCSRPIKSRWCRRSRRADAEQAAAARLCAVRPGRDRRRSRSCRETSSTNPMSAASFSI